MLPVALGRHRGDSNPSDGLVSEVAFKWRLSAVDVDGDTDVVDALVLRVGFGSVGSAHFRGQSLFFVIQWFVMVLVSVVFV